VFRPFADDPETRHSFADTQDTEPSPPPDWPASSFTEAAVHLTPFRVSSSGLSAPPGISASPTATQSLAVTHDSDPR
jgi:hypothetical protein